MEAPCEVDIWDEEFPPPYEVILENMADKEGLGLHHFCLKVENVGVAFVETAELGLPPVEERPRQGTQGKRALFLDKSETDGVLVELTDH